jgi:energy-coupling factor transporter ATP-binding protein EcfA2
MRSAAGMHAVGAIAIVWLYAFISGAAYAATSPDLEILSRSDGEKAGYLSSDRHLLNGCDGRTYPIERGDNWYAANDKTCADFTVEVLIDSGRAVPGRLVDQQNKTITLENDVHSPTRRAVLPDGQVDVAVRDVFVSCTGVQTPAYRRQIFVTHGSCSDFTNLPGNFRLQWRFFAEQPYSSWVIRFVEAIAASIALAGLYLLIMKWRRNVESRRSIQEAHEALRFEIAVPEARTTHRIDTFNISKTGTVPAVPQKLVEACSSGRCVLFAGPGLSARAGLPTRFEMALQLVRSSALDISEAERQALRTALQQGDASAIESVNGAIAARTSKSDLADIVRWMTLERRPAVSEAHAKLAPIPFASAITVNYDNLLETVFQSRRPQIFDGEQLEMPKSATSSEPFVIVKLLGSPSSLESFRFLTVDYRDALANNRFFRAVVESYLSSHSLVFIGASSRQIRDFFESFPRSSIGTQTHYALLPRTPELDVMRAQLQSQYNLEILPFEPTQGFPEVEQFIAALQARVKLAPYRETQAAVAISDTRLTSVTLHNIGPFVHEELRLGQDWNVLLGDNGSGKSTILRAIALALCWGEPDSSLTFTRILEGAAARILRSGCQSGFIELALGSTTYRTTIKCPDPRRRDQVRIDGPITPFQRGNWLVLGFPPLRGISQREPIGPAAVVRGRPEIADLIPILDTGLDTRLDDLKQWIVNLDMASKDVKGTSSGERDRSRRILDSFFEILSSLTPGISIAYSRIEPTTWKVLIDTPDGEVPIDQVSQGMASMLGWVGTTLQRLYEVYPASHQPQGEPFVLLIDELDAHLHPEWQRRIVRLIQETFPKAQVVTTTHSPLAVAEMHAEEVLVARREVRTGPYKDDRDRVTVRSATVDIDGFRADQILTSPLFGLITTRSDRAAANIDEYAKLTAKHPAELTEDERNRLAELSAQLDKTLSLGETELERRVEIALRNVIRYGDAAHLAEAEAWPAADPVEAEINRQLLAITAPLHFNDDKDYT